MISPRSWCYIAGSVIACLIMGMLLKTTVKRVTYSRMYREGYNEFIECRYKKSTRAFAALKDIYPEHTEADPLLAASYYYSEDYQKAGILFEGMRSVSGRSGAVLSEFSRLYSEDKITEADIPKYISKLKIIDEDDPNIIANAVGISLLKDLSEKEAEEGVALIEKKVLGRADINPGPLSLAYNSMGCLKVNQGKYAEAVVDFDRARTFTTMEKISSVLEGNKAVAWILKEAAAGVPDEQGLGKAREYMKKLTRKQKILAYIGFARAYLSLGKIKETRNFIDFIHNPSPDIERKLINMQMKMLRQEGMEGGKKTEEAYAKLSILIEKILERIEKGEKELASFYDVKSMLYFIMGFYYAQERQDKMQDVLKRAIVLYPDNFSFLRNEGILKLRKGKFKSGFSLLERSCKQNPGQADAASFVDKAKGQVNTTSFRIFTGNSFSHRSPLVHITFEKDPFQPCPKVEQMTMGGVPLEPVVFGNSIIAVPDKPLPKGFSDYKVVFTTVNPLSGTKKSRTLTTDQDLTLPEITVHSPAAGAEVSRFNFQIHISVSDKDSGIDISTLNISFRPSSEQGNRFVSYIVKKGIYSKVRRKRGEKVDPSGKVTAIVPVPMAGTYKLTVEVSDKAFNTGRVSGFEFTAK